MRVGAGILKKQFHLLFSLLTIAFLVSSCTVPPAPVTSKIDKSEKSLPYAGNQSYIVNCRNECEQFASAIRSAGGNIQQRYLNVSAISFQLDDQSRAKNTLLSRFPIYKDISIAAPEPVKKHLLQLGGQNPGTVVNRSIKNISGINTKNYAFTNQITGALKAHQENNLGQDVIVAIIDSGTANNADVVPILAGSVMGGENLLPFDPDIPDEPSATSTKNNEHGTWVGTMIAGHAGLIINKEKDLAQAVMRHAPDSILPVSDTEIEIPMIGSAPGARIYALKIFSFTGGGTSSLISIAAMDRILTLKNNFNNGVPSKPVSGDGSEDNPFVYDSLNIQVLNMSLGGAALFPGQEIEDLFTDALLEAGVVVVASAGNEGFAAMTGGSPATGVSSISVGAANDATNERIFADLVMDTPQGIEFRPTDNQVIADFSSRGPTADGRYGVDIVANGVAAFVQGADGHIGLVSGTSFSSPTVAGAAALLWNIYPQYSASDIRAALIEGANPEILADSTSRIDQGHGFLDIQASLALLSEGTVEDHLPKMPAAKVDSKVANNIRATGVDVISQNHIQQTKSVNLVPGQVEHFFIETNQLTSALSIEIEKILPSLPATDQNTLFGDELIITIVDAPLSFNDIIIDEFISADKEYQINNPQHGIVRVGVMGSWTNVGNVSAEISIERKFSTAKSPSVEGTISELEDHQFSFNVDSTVTDLKFNLSWDKNWAYYPTHDLDLIITDPQKNEFFRGATLDSPEIVNFT